ncbi:urate hydroxylase PuuD [Bosea sp. PAMC 26642]|uniref:urate hydroxylase PuuD n=1 Tax=Bosea sp. (strain PAMC 26642) TaxID=1792307 RepID=UPI000770118B|nr:urate hydroxylase PuuD [Bosea sp. PAMC 26642]AMJ60561.1 cysteine desulfurase [Bosea sp. PAMC 26642]
MLDAYLMEWGSQLLRWLHVITAIAWIGSSFFFIHLDASLRGAADIPAGEGGRAWQVHGGGFYEMRKYMVAPAVMPAELTWHKWQAYWTWISGFFLLVWVYYAQSELYLIDPAVMQLSPLAAGAIGIAALALGWLFYDWLCRSPLGRNDVVLGLLGFSYVVAASWAFASVFSGRGALIHTGALMATIMTANVFFNIMPGQRKVIAALTAGEKPDPKYGKAAKQRSTHNNYITLPVLFLMLSNHYPVTYANSAVIPALVALIIVAGALIRHFFNVRHADHAKSPWWTWAVALAALWLAFWLAMASSPGRRDRLGLAPLPERKPMLLAGLALPPVEVANIVSGRCAMCHAPEPSWPGLQIAPKGVLLHEPEFIAAQARAIRVQAVMTHAMPPNNLSGITPAERRVLAAWLSNTR